MRKVLDVDRMNLHYPRIDGGEKERAYWLNVSNHLFKCAKHKVLNCGCSCGCDYGCDCGCIVITMVMSVANAILRIAVAAAMIFFKVLQNIQ